MATVSLGRPDLVIDRSVLLGELGKLAEGAGARVVLGRRFVGLRARGETMGVLLEDATTGAVEEVVAKTVIGADGAFSGVARAAGWPRQRTVPLLQAVVTLPKHLPSDTARVWFRPNETPYFYWLIPESEDLGVSGLIGEHGADTRLAELLLAKGSTVHGLIRKCVAARETGAPVIVCWGDGLPTRGLAPAAPAAS